ncbi:NAD-dependent dehydratase, partial [Candidatus Collierbacteria bacterium CG10_big_fil_rev_8_21_14_0_10_44_9]
PQKRQPDISKAKQLLGWEPTIDFSSGMKKTLEHYEK